MTSAIIAGLTGLGVASIVGEKILNNMGKVEMGSFVGLTGYTQLAISAIGGVVKLISVIAKIG
jgi:hypothetical protein